jgi:type VI secretion system VasD/TssJ family lipoprotein
MKYLRILSILVLFLISSCASKPAPPVVQQTPPTYTQNFIQVRLEADPQLNVHDGLSHALHLCVYQLVDPNAFNQISEDQMGISKLLGCERFDPGVALSRKLIVQPGEKVNLRLDRAEGAKYVGIAAGYYTLQKKNSIRLYSIPLIEERKGSVIDVRQAPLNIDLYLGSTGLRDAGGRP